MRSKPAEVLLSWYDENKRSMPWRGVGDPYAVWVSEIMLQQTRVDTVMRFYPRFMERFPTIRALAEAPVEDVLKQWEGLGYYRRARNLQLGAQQVMDQYGGVMPEEPSEIRRLAGVGDYTAGAIASIAFNKCVPAVDGNVIRVISRIYDIRENAAQPDVLRRIAGTVTDIQAKDRPGDFNQALMDLGATICTPGTPDCDRCPMRSLCAMKDPDEAAGLPVLPERTRPKELYYDVWLMTRDGQVLMQQRTEKLLQGLWVFPMAQQGSEPPVPVQQVKEIGEARHVFTHQVWFMRVFAAVTDCDAPRGCRFVDAAQISELAVPNAMRVPLSMAVKLLKGT